MIDINNYEINQLIEKFYNEELDDAQLEKLYTSLLDTEMYVIGDNSNPMGTAYRVMEDDQGNVLFTAFTDMKSLRDAGEKVPESHIMRMPMAELFVELLDQDDMTGIYINSRGNEFLIDEEVAGMIVYLSNRDDDKIKKIERDLDDLKARAEEIGPTIPGLKKLYIAFSQYEDHFEYVLIVEGPQAVFSRVEQHPLLQKDAMPEFDRTIMFLRHNSPLGKRLIQESYIAYPSVEADL